LDRHIISLRFTFLPSLFSFLPPLVSFLSVSSLQNYLKNSIIFNKPNWNDSRNKTDCIIWKYTCAYLWNSHFGVTFTLSWWIQDTRVSSIVCFTILVLPVLLDEEYWSFQYRVFYNTSITSIVGWRILEIPVLCIDQRFWLLYSVTMEKIWFCWRKIVIFHTKYPKNFPASLRSVQFF
jgi:hypothetical protein